MNLRSKFLCIIFAFLVLQLGTFYTYCKVMLLPQFEAEEQAQAQKNLTRSINVVQNSLNNISMLGALWARNINTIPNKLDHEIPLLQKNMIEDKLNLLLTLDADHNVQFQLNYDNQTQQNAPLPEAINNILQSPSMLKAVSRSGLVLTEQGPMLMAITPMANKRLVIIGQLITQTWLEDISFMAQAKIQLWPMATTILPANLQILQNIIQASPDKIYLNKNKSTFISYKILSDIQGLPNIVLASTLPRESSLIAQQSFREIYAVLLMANFILVLLLLTIVNDTIIKPTKKLTHQLYDVDDNIDAPLRIQTHSKDELGVLSEAMNTVIIHFCDNRTAAIRKAYQAGTQSMRSEMLQDVIYTTEPAIQLADRIEKSLHQLPLNVLEKVTAEFITRPPEAERQTLLIEQLSAINLALRLNIKEIREEVRELRLKVLRVATTIRSHALNLESPKAYTLVKSKQESELSVK